jgi:hypothetical protein
MTPGTLNPGEIHPAAQDAMAYIRSVPTNGLFNLVEVFASVALSGNRNAEICGETLQRILNGEPVSDRYILGLAWSMKTMETMGVE